MKRLKYTFLGFFTVLPAMSEEPKALLEHMMAVCAAHPEFRASSIDFYDPTRSPDYEVEFYEASKKLHALGSMNYVFYQRKKQETKQKVQCIDNILNTWPG